MSCLLRTRSLPRRRRFSRPVRWRSALKKILALQLCHFRVLALDDGLQVRHLRPLPLAVQLRRHAVPQQTPLLLRILAVGVQLGQLRLQVGRAGQALFLNGLSLRAAGRLALRALVLSSCRIHGRSERSRQRRLRSRSRVRAHLRLHEHLVVLLALLPPLGQASGAVLARFLFGERGSAESVRLLFLHELLQRVVHVVVRVQEVVQLRTRWGLRDVDAQHGHLEVRLQQVAEVLQLEVSPIGNLRIQ
eukprot:scaffold71_cov247-Pinguiococcus_pyrenoidosus.AAC.9